MILLMQGGAEVSCDAASSLELYAALQKSRNGRTGAQARAHRRVISARLHVDEHLYG